MLDNLTKTTLILMLCLGLFSLHVEHTSADLTAQRTVAGNRLRATTISLDNLHTASFTSLNTLFTTSGFKPSGYDVRTLKIVKTGELDFRYRLKVEPVEGQSETCQYFSLRTDRDWTETYTGALMEFENTSRITADNSDDWLFYLSLNEEEGSPQNSSCTFRLLITTYRKDKDEPPTGLRARKLLDSTITTGTW